MKNRKSLFVAMICTISFTLLGITIAKADLEFTDLNGTWWSMLKQMDKGYVFPNPPENTDPVKVEKFKYKIKEGYMYIPPDSCPPPPASPEYEGVVAVDSDGVGGWTEPASYDVGVIGGTPYDFALHTHVAELSFELLTGGRVILTEDKKNPGMIKSGKMSTLGSSIQYYIPPGDQVFVGSRDLKAKLIPENKVPRDVIDAVNDFLNP